MYKLHSYWRSSCSWRVRWALELKNIPHEIVPVNLLKGEQSGNEYLSINPNGRLPTLSNQDINLSGSIAIIEYLEENHPTPSLLPQESASRAKVRELVNIIACDTQPIQNLAVMRHHTDDQEGRSAWAHHWIKRGLSAYEKIVQSTHGTYSFGDSITIADLCLVPQVYNARRFGVDLGEFPTVSKIWENCIATESCKKSEPESQPDAL